MRRKPHEYAGQTVRIRADVAEIGGQEYRVEDWWVNVSGWGWLTAFGDPAAIRYAARTVDAGLPIDDEVLYGKVGGFGYLVHVSEIEVAAVSGAS